MDPASESSAVTVAIGEVTSPTWGVTEQFLQQHSLRIDERGAPSVAGVRASSEPGALEIYFAVVDQAYHFVVLVDSDDSEALTIAGAYCEARTRAELVITSQSRSGEFITETIGLSPTSILGPDPQAKMPSRRDTTTWVLDPCAGEPGAVESKLTTLLRQLAPRATAVASLSDSCDIEVSLLSDAWLGNGCLGGLHLTAEQLQQVSTLGASLDFDTYASGPGLGENDS